MLEAERLSVRRALWNTQGIALEEDRIATLYPFRKSGYYSYDNTFKPVLNGQSIREVIAQAHSRVTPDHPQVAAADVMGSGWVFLRGNMLDARSLFDGGLDYGIGIALNNSRGPLRKFWDRQNGRDLDFVKGDIQLHSTWRKIDNLLTKRNIDGFDVMLVRGIAGADDLNPTLIVSSLKDAYARLTSHNGILLAQVPGFVGEKTLSKFADTARDHGIRVQLERGRIWKLMGREVRAIRIDKLPTSPQKLDFL